MRTPLVVPVSPSLHFFSLSVSLSPRRDDNRINVSLGFRQRVDQIRARGVETPDWLLYLTECLGEGGAVLVLVVGDEGD